MSMSVYTHTMHKAQSRGAVYVYEYVMMPVSLFVYRWDLRCIYQQGGLRVSTLVVSSYLDM
jgi:hypothetical protein